MRVQTLLCEGLAGGPPTPAGPWGPIPLQNDLSALGRINTPAVERRGNNLKGSSRQSQCQNLALTVSHVPYSLDSGTVPSRHREDPLLSVRHIFDSGP